MSSQYPPPKEYAALQRRLAQYRPVASGIAAVLLCAVVGAVLMQLAVF